MKATFVGALLLVTTLAIGCGGGDGIKTLDIADIGWTENTAIANLTKVFLEEELGYDQVLINNRAELTEVYEAVATGELDAFQDVWLPNQQDLLSSVEEDVEQLSFSYQGQTEQGITIPSYMDIYSLDQ